MLENTIFDRNCFLFRIDFKSLYTNISVKDAVKLMKMLFFNYQNVIPNANFIMEFMELVLNSAVTFANIYMAFLEEELYIILYVKIKI